MKEECIFFPNIIFAHLPLLIGELLPFRPSYGQSGVLDIWLANTEAHDEPEGSLIPQSYPPK